MNPKPIMKKTYSILALAAMALLFAGCSTSRYAQSDDTRVRTAYVEGQSLADADEAPAVGWTLRNASVTEEFH